MIPQRIGRSVAAGRAVLGNLALKLGMRPVTSPPLQPADLHVVRGANQGEALQPFVSTVLRELKEGRSSGWVVLNFAGLKYINDHIGHEAGNQFLVETEQSALDIAADTFGVEQDQINWERFGPNFPVNLLEGREADRLMQRYGKRFENGTTYSIRLNGKKIKVTYSQATEGRSNIFNQCQLIFDADLRANGGLKITEEGIFRGLENRISELNQGVRRDERVGLEKAALLNSYTLKLRHANPRKRVELPSGPNVEYRSGLPNVNQMLLDAAKMLEEGRSLHYAFFDINAMGAFQSIAKGPNASLMMEAMAERAIGEAFYAAREASGQEDIALYRHDRRSEEFYILADSNDVSLKDMRKFAEVYMKELDKALKLLVDREALEESQIGKGYLNKNPGLVTKSLPLDNGSKVKVVEMDVLDPVREKEGKQYRGLTVTMAVGTIDPHLKRSAQDVLEQFRHAITEIGEAAKRLNLHRRNLLVQVDFVDGYPIGRVVPLKAKISNPRPIKGYKPPVSDPFLDNLVDQAVQNRWVIEFTARNARLGSIIVRDKQGNIVKNKKGEGLAYSLSKNGYKPIQDPELELSLEALRSGYPKIARVVEILKPEAHGRITAEDIRKITRSVREISGLYGKARKKIGSLKTEIKRRLLSPLQGLGQEI
ncbi:MAG: hypothetical protein V3T21_02105 [Candidatus Margulisiibacteriota bacterium]